MCRKLLEDNKIEFKVIDYIKNPLTKNDIREILNNLDENLCKILREDKFKNQKISVSKLVDIIFKNPNLMQRPIVFHKKFYICRPPEKILEILGK
jgi:arsenate reductase